MRARVTARSESLISGVGPIVMFVAGRRMTESHSFTKRANMCADHVRTLDACGVTTPY